MIDRYLWISAGGSVFPCHKNELRLTLKYNESEILEKWPSHGHGLELRNTDTGVIILDLLHPDKPMTTESLKKLGVL